VDSVNEYQTNKRMRPVVKTHSFIRCFIR
jgi:hypothetical protein